MQTHIGLSILLFIHIITGSLGLFSGFATLFFRKGSKNHNSYGRIFVYAMMLMAASGSAIALINDILLSFFNGILVFYLVGTAWKTVRTKPNTTHFLDWLLLTSIVTVSFGLYDLGFDALAATNQKINGFPAPVFFFFASVALVAGLLDLKMILNGGISGKARLIRHLWRMCFALFMTTAAFFLGQAKLFPEFMQQSVLILLPVAIVLLTLFYWLLKMIISKNYKPLSRF